MYLLGNKENPRIIFIFDNITQREKKLIDKDRGQPFQSSLKRDLIFKKLINSIKIKPQEVLNIYIEKVKQDKIKQIKEELNEFIQKSLQIQDNLLIIPVGSYCCQVLLNKKKMTNISGMLFNKTINKKVIDIIPIINPESVSSKQSYNQLFIKSFEFIIRYYNNDFDTEDFNYKILTNFNEIRECLESLISNKQNKLILDIETNKLELLGCQIVGIALKLLDDDISYYISVKQLSEVELVTIKDLFKQLVRDMQLINHNIKFDLVRLKQFGFIDEYNVLFDTQLASHLKYNQSLGGLSLKHLCRVLFDVFEDWDKVIYKYRVEYSKKMKIPLNEVGYDVVPDDVLGKYACLDVYYTEKLYKKLLKELTEQEKIHLNERLLPQIEMVVDWELTGCKVDLNKLKDLKIYFEQELSRIINQINEIEVINKYFNNKFNINSPQQKGKVLQLLNTKGLKKTKTGISTSAENLEVYKEENLDNNDLCKFIDLILEYNNINKLYTSYVIKFPSIIDDYNYARVDFNICGTKTGRLSSFLHTIPSRSALGKQIKEVFVSRFKNGLVVNLDISQIEPRTLASLSQDKNLMKIYNEGKDIYKFMASMVFDVDYDKVEKPQRNAMKSLVLAILYGMSIKSFSSRIGVSIEEGEKIFNKFFVKFPEVCEFQQKIIKKGFRYKGIYTVFNRFIPINTYNKHTAERLFKNYIIQSSASEMALKMFCKFHQIMKRFNLKSKIILSVQDSVVIDLFPSEFHIICQIKQYLEKEYLKNFKFFKVPIVFDMEVGLSWGKNYSVKNILQNSFTIIKNCDIEVINRLSEFYNCQETEEGFKFN